MADYKKIVSDYWDGLAELSDVFFNGRPAAATVEAEKVGRSAFFKKLMERKVSYIQFGDTTYKVTVVEVAAEGAS